MDNLTLEYLKVFKKRNSLSLIQLAAILDVGPLDIAESINYMRDLNYLRISHNHSILNGDDLTLDAPLEITHYGKVSFENELKSRKSHKLNQLFNFGTLLIALAAFIKSFFF